MLEVLTGNITRRAQRTRDKDQLMLRGVGSTGNISAPSHAQVVPTAMNLYRKKTHWIILI